MKVYNIKTIIFFLIMLFLFILAVRGCSYVLSIYTNINEDLKVFLVGMIYTSIIITLFYTGKICGSNENYEKPNDVLPCMCKGGEYMYQSDSEKSRKCRQLFSTKEGRKIIEDSECKKGNGGRPNALFNYTPDSDGEWKNKRCENDI